MSVAMARPAASRLRVTDADEFHSTLTYSNLIVVVWYRPPRADLLHQLYGLGQRLTVELGVSKVSVVSIVQRKFREAPTPAARAALEMLHRDPKHILHRSALVFKNEGFVVASVRSLILGVRAKLAGASNNEVFQTFDLAASWATEGLVGPDAKPLPVLSIISDVNQHAALTKTD